MVLKFGNEKFLFALFFFGFIFLSLSFSCPAEDLNLQNLKKNAASHPNNPNAYFNLGLYYFQKGDFQKSLEALQRVLQLNKSDEEALVLLGTVYLHMGKLAEAEDTLRQVLSLDANNVDARNNLGLVYLNENKVDDAVHELQESLNIKPDNSDALNNLAFVYSSAGKTEEAIRLYKRITTLDPGNSFAYERLAQLLLENKQYPEVIKLYDLARTKVASANKLMDYAAFAHLYQGEVKQAYDYFSRANKSNPGDAESLFGMGLIAYKKADLDIAITKFKQAIDANSGYVEAYRQLAMVYEDKGEYIKALSNYRQVLKLSPNDRYAKHNYNSIRERAIDHYLRQGSQAYFENDYESAVVAWNNVKKLDPENETANKFIKTAQVKVTGKIGEHIANAETALLQNRQQDAYREYTAALKLDPKNRQAKQGIERVKLKQKDKDAIQTAQALDSIQKGANVQAALKELKISLKHDPTNLVAQKMVKKVQKDQQSGTERNYRKGIELFSKGQLRGAIASLEVAQEMDPNNQGIKNLLYKAKTQLRENIKALVSRGIELANAGRVPEAKEKFDEVLKLDPDNAEANEYSTKFTGKVAQVTVSKEEVKKLYYDGVSLYLDGQNRAAIEVWKKILVMDPDNQEAKSSIAKAEMELKEMEKRGIKAQ